MLKNLAINILLITISLLVCLVAIEASLRILYPKYQYAAESSFDRDSSRIWARKANIQYQRKHPDSEQSHAVYHNNLALRQHRNFTEEEMAAATNLGFFGDSFTENLRLPSQYSLTEPLDYLLNRQAHGFNVLNFGVDGYGTDQSYLYYSNLDYADKLDYVFYIFCLNDLRNIYENNLYTLNEEQELVKNTSAASPWWVHTLSRLHTTYLVLDIVKRLQSRELGLDRTAIEQHYKKKDYDKRFHDQHADAIEPAFLKGEQTEQLDKSIKIFQSLLRLWSDDVKSRGGKFYMVLLPRENAHKARNLVPEDINVINLYEMFAGRIDNYDYNDWRFETDGHWNEAGNMLAATLLFRIMEQERNLAPVTNETLKEWLYTYYSSFNGWMPEEKFVKATSTNGNDSLDIRLKYLELELTDSGS